MDWMLGGEKQREGGGGGGREGGDRGEGGRGVKAYIKGF